MWSLWTNYRNRTWVKSCVKIYVKQLKLDIKKAPDGAFFICRFLFFHEPAVKIRTSYTDCSQKNKHGAKLAVKSCLVKVAITQNIVDHTIDQNGYHPVPDWHALDADGIKGNP